MKKHIQFLKVVTFLLCVSLLQFVSYKALSQQQQNTFIFINTGVSNLNSGDLIKPYVCNEFGVFRKNDLSKYSGFGFGIIFKQTRSKTAYYIDTKSYISCPLYYNLSIRQFLIQTGIVCDMYAFRYLNYSIKSNEVYPYLLNFSSPSLSLANNGVLSFPFSIGYVVNASYFFKSNRFGLSVSFQISELISMYGRNFIYDENNKKLFYYPSSFSFGILYLLNSKDKF